MNTGKQIVILRTAQQFLLLTNPSQKPRRNNVLEPHCNAAVDYRAANLHHYGSPSGRRLSPPPPPPLGECGELWSCGAPYRRRTLNLASFWGFGSHDEAPSDWWGGGVGGGVGGEVGG